METGRNRRSGFGIFGNGVFARGTKNINLGLVLWRSCMTATARDITFRIDVETLAYNIVANLLKRSNEGRNSGILVTIAVF
jgi:hypothetical protein